MITERDTYLDDIRRQLTRSGMREKMPADWPLRRRLLLQAFNALNPLVMRTSPFGQRKRDLGLVWPAEAETMIGMRRLTSLQHCVETVLTDDIPGDLVECGVWRGGACILMRAVLAAYGDETRTVWAADSFQGFPPEENRDRMGMLAVSEDEVRANFARYGLLDEHVRFLPGWFKDTLPDAPIDRIAVLRLDGDLYESTIQALEALYLRLSPGGFCIIDDYHPIRACRQAVTDYRAEHGISAEIIDIDGTGVLWRK